MEQWTICWENRRGLPTLVHDNSLLEVILFRLDLGDETTPVEDRIRMLNTKAGPLSPAFVKRLLPPQNSDDYVQQQLRDGRKLPWQLKKEVLESPMNRSDQVVEDPATKDMKLGNIIPGTKTTYVPEAGKQKYFQSLDQEEQNRKDEQAAQQDSDSHKQGSSLNLGPLSRKTRSVRTSASRTYPEGKWAKRDDDDEMAVTCDNCGTEGHDILECPSPCKECGKSMPHHAGQLVNGQCMLGCLCRDGPGHKRPDCDRLCRPCFIENRDSTTAIKDCKKHCQLHMCHTQDGQDQGHSRCVKEHNKCPLCYGRHWHQDCPKWLGTLCLRQDCLGTKCNIHCHTCGGYNIEEIMSLLPKNDNLFYKQHVQALVRTWHEFLDDWQWERVQAPTAAACIELSPWSVLRCRRHENVTADACTLEKKRAHTWKMVVDCVRGEFTEETVSKAERLLQIPECRDCFDQWLFPIELVLGDSTRRSQKQRAAGLSPSC